MALLTAAALIMFTVEAQLPAPVPIPGVKLGLANIITVWAMFALGPRDSLMILLARTLLGSMFSGAMSTLFYSLGGGLACWLVSCLLRKILSERQIWVAGVIGAIAHNLGQTGVAVLLYGSFAPAVYLPVLMLSGILTGLFTGLIAQLVYGRLQGRA